MACREQACGEGSGGALRTEGAALRHALLVRALPLHACLGAAPAKLPPQPSATRARTMTKAPGPIAMLLVVWNPY